MIVHTAAGWRIRPYRPADERACAGIFLACLRDFVWRGGPTARIGPLRDTLAAATVWVADVAQAGPVGFLAMSRRDAYVTHLFVAQDWRFCGVGRGLLQTARGAAGRPLTLSVDAENQTARAAYEAMGWRETGVCGRHGRIAWRELKSL